jgi:hypothetical protein
MEDIKRIDIKEFREKGYLQEVNRKFLHPLGLALEIIVDDNGIEKLGGIWDSREDEEGIYYNLSESDEERIERFKTNEDFVNNELNSRKEKREKLLGFNIEPIK